MMLAVISAIIGRGQCSSGLFCAPLDGLTPRVRWGGTGPIIATSKSETQIQSSERSTMMPRFDTTVTAPEGEQASQLTTEFKS